MNDLEESSSQERLKPGKLLGRYRSWALMVAVGSFLVGFSQVTGLNVQDLLDYLSPPAALTEKDREALRAQVRALVTDTSLSVEDSRKLREYVAGLQLDAKLAEGYLSEVTPEILQAASALREGAQLAVQGRFPAARERFQEAARLDGENATAWANLGGAALEMGDTVEAEAALRKALDHEPRSIEALYNLGACLALQNHQALAFDHLERALALLSQSDAPVFDRQAVLDDLENGGYFESLRGSPRFAALVRRAHDDLR